MKKKKIIKHLKRALKTATDQVQKERSRLAEYEEATSEPKSERGERTSFGRLVLNGDDIKIRDLINHLEGYMEKGATVLFFSLNDDKNLPMHDHKITFI